MNHYEDVQRKPEQPKVVPADPDSYELFAVVEPHPEVSPRPLLFRPLGAAAAERMPLIDARSVAANDGLEADEDPFSVAS
jgi:hypothetical protein